MKRKISVLAAAIMLLACVFTCSTAFDSPWDHYTGPLVPYSTENSEESRQEIRQENIMVTENAEIPGLPDDQPEAWDPSAAAALPIQTEILDMAAETSRIEIPEEAGKRNKFAITLNSLQINGTDEQTKSAVDMLNGMRIEYAEQTDDEKQSSFAVYLKDSPLLTYSLREGTPYYVSSNFLGNSTFRITPEDQFEENLAMALYDLIEKMSSGNQMPLPPREEILTMIQTIRESKDRQQVQMSFESTVDFDPGILMLPVLNLMARLEQTEPADNIRYSYSDIENSGIKFEWPNAADLPEIPRAEKAMTTEITGTDLLLLIDSLSQMMENNPELAEQINRTIEQSLSRSMPGMSADSSRDYARELLSGIRETVQKSLIKMSLLVRIDMDHSEAPVLITIRLEIPEERSTNGFILRLLTSGDETKNVHEASVDMYSDEQILPIFRMIAVNQTASEDKSSLNFCFRNMGDFDLEFAAASHTAITTSELEFRDSEIKFDLNGINGDAAVLNTAYSNAFGGKDTVTEITGSVKRSWLSIASFSLSIESAAAEGITQTIPENTIAATEMTAQDYNSLAQSVFLQLMSAAMNLR